MRILKLIAVVLQQRASTRSTPTQTTSPQQPASYNPIPKDTDTVRSYSMSKQSPVWHLFWFTALEIDISSTRSTTSFLQSYSKRQWSKTNHNGSWSKHPFTSLSRFFIPHCFTTLIVFYRNNLQRFLVTVIWCRYLNKLNWRTTRVLKHHQQM
jgi:hypothetical protein